jgi:hypothetical protein
MSDPFACCIPQLEHVPSPYSRAQQTSAQQTAERLLQNSQAAMCPYLLGTTSIDDDVELMFEELEALARFDADAT